MSCCPASDVVKANVSGTNGGGSGGISHWVEQLDENRQAVEFLLPTIHCGGCISKIESALQNQEGVEKARVNLSTKRLSLVWDTRKQSGDNLIKTVVELGYDARPFDMAVSANADNDETGTALLRALAVAGFAAANVMLLSISVWAGAEGTTKLMFQWLSALIALPAIVYAGRPFFKSGINALVHKRLNMDVPISLAVILAAGMSLYETINQGQETYFDAAVTLLFFLLIGRYLDHMMREKARSAVSQLLTLNSVGATVINQSGEHVYVPVNELQLGMRVLIVAGERIPVDGVVVAGLSDVDRSIVTGESLPEKLTIGAQVEAGILNVTGPLEIEVSAVGKNTFLGEVISLMETAEQGKAAYRRIADRAAQIYAPAVHALAAITFLAWLWWTGGDWHASLYTAIAVLIITCPCALGLAVPAVQIVASGVLFKRGVLVKDGGALERMADIDTVIFDKTGTLTTGEFDVEVDRILDEKTQRLALAMAQTSLHPLSKSIVSTCAVDPIRSTKDNRVQLDQVTEIPGQGIKASWNGKNIKLGHPNWVGGDLAQSLKLRTNVCLTIDGEIAAVFSFKDNIREGAREVIAHLQEQGKEVKILSGDVVPAVQSLANKVGVNIFHAQQTPQQKVSFIEQEIQKGKKVLMVGDGINDAPALAAATASLAPSTASDIGKTAADMIFTTNNLMAVLDALDVSQRSIKHVHQNFGLAIAYNVIAVPLAMLGFATPLFAAIAMSSSSILVTTNALRLRLATKPQSSSPSRSVKADPANYAGKKVTTQGLNQ